MTGLKSGTCRIGLLSSMALGMLPFWTTVAAAQDAASATSGETGASASDAEAESSSGLEDIVVTARKRSERAQDTPISLTVATGESLDNRSVTNFIDLQQQTPSLHMVPASLVATAVNVSMRGQSLVDIRLNIDPAIGVYLDGVYLPRTQGLTTAAIADLDRVEVLAGPQGTLYGKNTTGGAIVLYTNQPSTDAYEGSLKGRYGNYGERSLTGVLNVPVTNNLAFRIVGNLSGRDGYGENLFNGDPAGRYDSTYFRGSLLFSPTENLTVTLRGDYTRVKTFRDAYKGLLTLAPLTPGVGLGGPRATVEAALEYNNLPSLAAFQALPAATQAAYLQQADGLLRSYVNGNPNDSNTDQRGYEDASVWGYSATVDLDLSETISAKSITAYRAFRRTSTIDQDGTPFAIIQTPYSRTADHQFSQELQLSGTFWDGRLKSIVGLYYANEDGDEDIYGLTTRVLSGANPVTFQEAEVGNSSLGVFTQNTFKITDQLSVTGGIRYSKDKRNVLAHTRNSTICTALGRPLADIGGAGNCNRDMEAKFSKVSYTLGVEYSPTQDLLFYGKINRGYRSGGLQQNAGGPSPAVADAANLPFRPETVDDMELGFKSEFWDRRIRVNLAYYHAKQKNAQRNVSVPVPGTTSLATRVQNAASAVIDGVEWDIAARPTPSLELSFNGAYTNGRFKNYITPTGEDRSGIPLLLTPKWQYGLSAAHTFDIGSASWRNQVDYAWSGRQLTAEPAGYSPSHGILNARTSLSFEEKGLDFALYVKNITKERYPTYPVDVLGSLGFIWASSLGSPRTYGIEVTARF